LDQAEIEEAVKELEHRVDRLRSLYEQYFMGIEKIEPGVPKKDVERRVQTLRREQIRNTALRFRFQMVLQRYNTYLSYWLRICREIDEGTYKRNTFRAKARLGGDAQRRKKRAAGESEAPPSSADDLELSVADFEQVTVAPAPKPPPLRPPLPLRALASSVAPAPAPSVAPAIAPAVAPAVASAGPIAPRFGSPPKPTQSRMKMAAVRLKGAMSGAPTSQAPPGSTPASTPAPPAARPTPAPPAVRPTPAPTPAPTPPPVERPRAAGDLSDERVRQLYSQYVDTKRKQNESTASLTYDNLAKTLRESTAKLKEKHAGKSVDFEVTVKDGKTVLKPIVREGPRK
jgi:hypothetical protein